MAIRRTLRALSLILMLALAAVAPARAGDVRIVALVPSLAEDAFAIGAHVVAVSNFTDDIAGARGLPRVADFQSVDVERIVALHPDVVVGIPSQARFVAPLRRVGIRVVLVADDGYDDIFRDIRMLGTLAHHERRAAELVRSLQAQTAALVARAHAVHGHPSVFVALGTGPVWTAGAGSYVAHLIELAGGRDAASDLHAPWGAYSDEALLRAQPDAIVSGPGTRLADVVGTEPWRSLRAVREGHVFTTPNARIEDALFRPGPNYNEGLRWLIARLSSL
ncbi:MAG: ABC transporter substrate-binding protein [bacterium]|nr:ABC transporter substrate-binding protein [bacterium]